MPESTQVSVPPVKKTIVVACTPEAAFRYFTADMGKWWPLHVHSCIAQNSKGAERPVTCVLEERKGGRVFERGASGEEHLWGNVFVWDPPAQVAFSWHPTRGADTAQRVEVRFEAEGSGTRVHLTHSGWEALGERALETRNHYNNGWNLVILERFPDYVRRLSNP